MMPKKESRFSKVFQLPVFVVFVVFVFFRLYAMLPTIHHEVHLKHYNYTSAEDCYQLDANFRSRPPTTEDKKLSDKFQPIDVDGSLSYVFSAYIDDRQGTFDFNATEVQIPVVRLFAFVHRLRHLESQVAVERWRCLQWDEDFNLMSQTPVLNCADLNFFRPFATSVAPVMLTCRPTHNFTSRRRSPLKYISIVTTTQCHRPRNLLPVVDLPAIRRTSTNETQIRHNEFVICPKPLYPGDVMKSVQQLVEFIEINRMFGANLIHIYAGSSAWSDKHASVRLAMEQYQRLGVVEMTPWNLPADILQHVPWGGQYLTVTECLYRMMYRSDYVIHQDFDEFIVPTKATTWRAMLESVNRKEADKRRLNERNSSLSNADAARNFVASYNFRHRLFPLHWPLGSAVRVFDKFFEEPMNGADSSIQQFRTLGRVLGESRLLLWGDRSKVIARPEKVLIADIHGIHDAHVVPIGQGVTNCLVEETDGVLHHYRRPFQYPLDTPATYNRLTYFAPEIIRRLRKGLLMRTNNNTETGL